MNRPMTGAERQRLAEIRLRKAGGDRRTFNLERDVNEGLCDSMRRHGDANLTATLHRLLRKALRDDDTPS